MMSSNSIEDDLIDDEIYGQLIFNPLINRYQLNEYEFHCGDKLWVLIVDKASGLQEWKRGRIELGVDGWYIVDVFGYSQLDGLWARR